MFDLCYKRHVRSGIAGILLQATDKGIKGEGGGTRCTERSRAMSSGVAPHGFFWPLQHLELAGHRCSRESPAVLIQQRD